MALVKIVDIDGVQWEMKDQTARNKITDIEKNISTEDLQNAKITVKDGYTCKTIQIENHYKAGKIHFAVVGIDNLSGSYVGTDGTIQIAYTNLIPKKYTNFILRDAATTKMVRCALEIDGSIYISESNGINNGANMLRGELIFAEP